MTNIEIYTKNSCPYCDMAKNLLKNKGATWKEINLSKEPEKTDEMMQRADGRMTVPEIFIDNKLVGGYDDLAKLEREGKLNQLLED